MVSQSASLYCRQQLMQILTLQQEQVIAYTEYLDTVKQCVQESDSARLDQLLKQIPPGTEIIEQTQQQQASLLSEYGYEVSQSGLNACIQDCGNDEQLMALKTLLDKNLRALEKSLFINSYLVRKNQDRVKQSIYILTGHQQQVDRSSTYSRQGNSENNGPDSRTLAQA